WTTPRGLVPLLVALWGIAATARAQPDAPAPDDERPRDEAARRDAGSGRVPTATPPSLVASDTAALAMAARLVVTSGVGGHFTEPVCNAERTLAPAPFAHVAPHLETLRALRPFVVDTGGLLAPNAVSMYAAARAPDSFAQLIAELGYDALTFGEGELSAERAPLVDALRALRQRGVPTIASNLRCDPDVPEAVALCDVLVNAEDGVPMVERGADRIAFLTFLDEGALQRATTRQSAGLRLTPVARAIGPAVVAARARGATLVVVVVDDAYGAQAAARALTLARQLDQDARPDLMIAANAGSELLFARPVGFRPAVASAPPGGGARIDVRRNDEAHSLDILVRPLEPAPAPARAIGAFIERFGETYCAAWGHDLPGGRVSEPLDGAGLLRLSGSIVREQTGAEVALLNRGLLDPSWSLGTRNHLRASDVHVAIQYDEPLVTATVSGTWLRDVARRGAARPELLALGLAITNANASDESVTVNGRPLELLGRYRVVTLHFLAKGGDGLLPDLPTLDGPWEPVVGEHGKLRDAVLTFLESPATDDPRERADDPADHPEWVYGVGGSVDFGGSSVRNQAEYGDSQLQRANTATLGLLMDARANTSTPNYAWDNTLNVQYRLARTTDGDGRYLEGDDQIRYRTTARWRRFRVASQAWYVPEPFVEGYVETEFSQPAARDFRHFLLRTTAGARFTLTSILSVRLNAGIEVELLDPNRNVQPGAGFVVTLEPWTVFETDRQKVTTGFQADWFVSDLGGDNRRTLRGTFDLSVAVIPRFALVMALQLYGVRAGSDGFAYASNVTAAARVSWMGRGIR
ncbi:MAG: 5'-nucleotidase C-terminal domain-containing protein, partial [Myxococcales bacterium]|nr:5'-nucleotidase C-terminal domain-containing protein [Myxococcales bacterium]